MLIENTSRSDRRAPEEHNKKEYPYRCDVTFSHFFLKKNTYHPPKIPCYLIFLRLTFQLKFLEFNPFYKQSF
jgi:hypothetical protein